MTSIFISCSDNADTAGIDKFNSVFNILFFSMMAVSFSVLGYLILEVLTSLDDDLYQRYRVKIIVGVCLIVVTYLV